LVLGQFRTQILDDSRKGGNLSPTGLPEYDAIKTEMSARHKETHGKQPGGPTIAAERIVDIARLGNLNEDQKRSLSFRIPVGSDALKIMRLKCTGTLQSLNGWEGFARSTDFADIEAIPGYFR
jgi:hypothetical protein